MPGYINTPGKMRRDDRLGMLSYEVRFGKPVKL